MEGGGRGGDMENKSLTLGPKLFVHSVILPGYLLMPIRATIDVVAGGIKYNAP